MKEISCEQISVLLTYFIDKKLNKKLMTEIEYHLNICENCRKKYMNLLKITQNYEEIREKIYGEEDNKRDETDYLEKEYKLFQENLSAYIDNELEDKENIRIKKIAIMHPAARQELEDIICFRQLLQDSFKKTKSKMKKDLSGWTIDKICTKSKEESSKTNITQVLNIVLFFTAVCAACAFAILK